MIYNAKSDISGTMSSFNYRKKITINHSGALAVYQVKLTIDHVNTNMRTDFGDIRFNTDTGNYIPYWIEAKVDDVSANVWIKADLVDGNTIIYMYYGNSSLTSASDGTSTFIFFDDFNTGSLDTSKWTGSASLSGGIMTLTGINQNIDSKVTITSSSSFALRSNAQVTTTGGACGNYNQFGFSRSDIAGRAVFINWCNFSAGALSASGGWSAQNLYTGNVYHIFDIIYKPSVNIIFKVDGSTVATHSCNSPADQIVHFGTGDITGTVYSDWVLVRKYVDTEPTYTTSAEQTVTAKSMTISPRESPCRVGICIVDVNVTWTNTGESVIFTPGIIVDSNTHSLTPRTLPIGDTPIAFEMSGLTVGTHSICPDPN